MLEALFGSNGTKRVATDLCTGLGNRARASVFFAVLNVPDTIDGRFDMIVLHAWLVLERLNDLEMKDVSQALVNLLFAGFDESLRELGVGDIGIGHRIKKMADAFYGRLSAYGASTEQGALENALRRNVYRETSGCESGVVILAKYVVSARAHMANCDLANGVPDFGPLPAAAV